MIFAKVSVETYEQLANFKKENKYKTFDQVLRKLLQEYKSKKVKA